MKTKTKDNLLTTIRILVLMQLGDKMDVTVYTDKTKFLMRLLLRTVLLAFATAVIYLIMWVMQELLYATVSGDFLVFVLILMQVMGIVTCTLSLLKMLYQSKDNALLLSFPASHSEVFISKIVVSYITEFLRNLSILLPFLLAYGIFKIDVLHWVYFINAGILTALLPLLCVLVSALFSLPFMFVADFLKGQPIISTVLIIGIVGFAFYLVIGFLESLPTNGLTLVAYYQRMLKEFATFLETIAKYGLYLNFAKKVLIVGSVAAFGSMFGNYGLLIAVIVGLTALTVALTMPFYFKIASHAVEMAHIKHVTKSIPHRTTFGTFLVKELKLMLRDSDTVINSFIYLMLMPFLLFIINKVFSLVDTNLIGDRAFLVVNLCLALIMVMISNTNSATALSSEGNEFYLLKTAPSKTKQIAWAKILVNQIFSTAAVVASLICMALTTSLSVVELLHIFFIIMAINTSHMLWSFEFDLLNPQVKEYIATGTTQDNTNANKSMALGVALAFIFAALFGIMLFADEGGVDNIKVAWIKLLCIVTAFLAARVYLFISKLSLYFDDIEM